MWKAGDATYGHWITANTYQCGNPVQSGTQFTMSLSQGPAPGGGYCGRNQANPTDSSGSMIRLNFGQQYTWTFHYIDGTPADAAPGMGYDKDARSLIWQINPYATGSTCTQFWIDNGGVIGGPQQWDFKSCGVSVWRGTYTPGEVDDWKIVVVPSQTSTITGHITLYRNGVQVASYTGQNVSGSTGNPWWNFGPYKWIWETSPNDSTMTTVNATFQNMLLTTP
ncbi:hypothetical protein EPN44_01990 [bacterium]|nr:MAG: hypothetical protein EPN44_01990 [bacterium]